MRKAITETDRRRAKQMAYNEEHNINPETIFKTRDEILRSTSLVDSKTIVEDEIEKPEYFAMMSHEDQLAFLMKTMKKSAENLDFETAILIRDEVKELKARIRKDTTKRRRK